MNEQILAWLRAGGFPKLEPEYMGPCEGDMGLFCRGREVLKEDRDILGRRICRQKAVFTVALRTAEPKILDVILALEPVISRMAPIFGQDQKILMEKGRTARDSGGIPVREFQLTVEYTTKEE
jgi:hypothetical protein